MEQTKESKMDLGAKVGLRWLEGLGFGSRCWKCPPSKFLGALQPLPKFIKILCLILLGLQDTSESTRMSHFHSKTGNVSTTVGSFSQERKTSQKMFPTANPKSTLTPPLTGTHSVPRLSKSNFKNSPLLTDPNQKVPKNFHVFHTNTVNKIQQGLQKAEKLRNSANTKNSEIQKYDLL